MANLQFRNLRADEIDCRISTINAKGLSLLLYKDARCDMNILDETVGAYNWMRSHSRDNANCTVSIWDEEKQQWISKEDVGTESNTEAVKGLASDSFKRSCFNWGIGRELYTAPFIWIGADKCEITQRTDGKYVTYDRFSVKDITITDKKITGLSIYNDTKKAVVYTYGKTDAKVEKTSAATAKKESSKESEKKDPEKEEIKKAYLDLITYCTKKGLDVKKVCYDNNLTKTSSKDDFVKALDKVKAETEEDEYGKLPFEV